MSKLYESKINELKKDNVMILTVLIIMNLLNLKIILMWIILKIQMF